MANRDLIPLLLAAILVCGIAIVESHRESSSRRSRHAVNQRSKRGVCDNSYKYRTYDGSCNNLAHPEYGMRGEFFRRVLKPKYENNDGRTPRLTGVSGATLPSPRFISTRIHDSENKTNPHTNLMHMQWAQFIDHDITYTPATVEFGSNCCWDMQTLVTEGKLHPHVKTGGMCFPIIIPKGDRYFDTFSSRCMEFVRSDAMKDWNNVRQQYNDRTPWLDASQIYAETYALAEFLRSYKNGKLWVKTVGGEDFLPLDDLAGEENCFALEPNEYCFLTGDYRVNMYPGLAAMHTVFMRYHNKICDRLKAVHGFWGDQKLYQEARRIIIAVYQAITYNEFLRSLFSPTDYDAYIAGYTYDPSVDPTLPNVFSTAAFRYGHSLVTDSLTIDGKIYPTGKLFMRPKYVLNSLQGVIEGLMNEDSQRTDRWYTTGMTDQMFEKPNKPKSGFDIVSRNIQRGRDHGLPPYNDWREKYGFPRLTDFSDMETAGQLYESVYESVDDIDVYSGALSERPSGGIVGPLYARILAEQFRDLKVADRFWYENTQNGNIAFTEDQIININNMKLSKVFCDTMPGLKRVPRNVFNTLSDENPLVNCSSLPDLDIEGLW